MDMLANGLRWLDRQRAEFISQEVEYARGSSSIAVPATKSKSVFELVDANGAMLRVETIDWLISRKALCFDGKILEPLRDDKIIEGGLVYQVLSPDGHMPHFRYCDPHRITLRIFSKLVEDRS